MDSLNDLAQLYTGSLAILSIFIAPVSVGSAVFLWGVHAEDRLIDERVPPPMLRLSLVMAVSSTIAAVAAVYIGILAILALQGVAVPIWTATITATVFVALDVIPILNAGYLRWLRRRRSKAGQGRRPPPWSRED